MSPSHSLYFLYGLAFFTLGLAIWLRATGGWRTPVARTFHCLAMFGIVHGIGEWLIMLRVPGQEQAPLAWTIATVAALSYAALMLFAIKLLALVGNRDENEGGRAGQWIPLALLGLWAGAFLFRQLAHTGDAALSPTSPANAEIAARYLLGLPAGSLAAYGFARLASVPRYEQSVRNRAAWGSALFASMARLRR